MRHVLPLAALVACAAATPAPLPPAAIDPAGACAGLDHAGCCDGETLVWSEGGLRRNLDCRDAPRCGWNEDAAKPRYENW